MLRWELDVRSNVFYTTQAEETTMYPSMRRTTRDNLELHYAQYTWLSSLCAFSAKGILHFITSVISISKPSSGKKRHFIIYLLEGMLFFRFGIFHFLFYSRTVCVWEREGMCDAQHKEISPWPLLSIWSFVYWLIPSEIFLWGFDVRRRIFESKHWAARNLEYHRKLSPNLVNRNLEISKLVTALEQGLESRLMYFDFVSSMQQMVCRFCHWRHFSRAPCWQLASQFYWSLCWPYESDATPSQGIFATTRTNILVSSRSHLLVKGRTEFCDFCNYYFRLKEWIWQ